jgi:hypothetical protein
MKLEALGINPKTGRHRKNPMTLEEQAFLGILWVEHEGKENTISADDLAKAYEWKVRTWSEHEKVKREIRYLQNHLLVDHNIPVLSMAGEGGGYWIAASESEAFEFYDTFRKRGLTGLVKASRGKQSAMVDMVAQLSFEFEDLVDKTGIQTQRIVPKGGTPAPIEVVDAFLERMTRDPAKFADGLRKIGQKYGGVLLPKEKLVALRSEVARVQELVRSLEG